MEVKYRKGQMSSQEVRSFLGGRYKDDRGLYVSSVGFTKDAQYEADRASIPLAMWTHGPCGPRIDRALRRHRCRDQANRAAEAAVLAGLTKYIMWFKEYEC